MRWLLDFLTSSIGKKILMSLTGIFLITFLIVHLMGNLQLIYADNGKAFNIYADFMTHNPLIQTVAKGLYACILLHAFLGLYIYVKNRKSKGKTYRMNTSRNAGFASKNMALLGTLVLFFLFIHMGDFWFKLKFKDSVFQSIQYAGISHPVKDAYSQVQVTFSKPIFVILYIIGILALSLHLWHGFESAFQTLGLNHRKYTPLIKFIGKLFAIIVPIGFVIIPIYMYFNK